MLPVYVINLDRRADRWTLISRQLTQLGIEATRIPGAEAQLLAEQPDWRINFGSAAGMIGHSKAMFSLLGSSAPAALILEDDAEIAQDTPLLLEATDWWPPKTCIVRLYGGAPDVPRMLWNKPSGVTPSGRCLYRLERWNNGGVAYLINRTGARLSLKAFSDPRYTVDHTLFDLRFSRTARLLRPMQIIPAAARHRDYDDSDQVQWREAHGIWRRPNVRAVPYTIKVAALRALGKISKRPVVWDASP